MVSVPLARAAAWLVVSAFGVSNGAPNQGVLLLSGVALQLWYVFAAVASIAGVVVIAVGSYTPPNRDDAND